MTMEKCVETKVSQNEFTFCENVTYIFLTLKLRETSQEFHVWSNMKQYFFSPFEGNVKSLKFESC